MKTLVSRLIALVVLPVGSLWAQCPDRLLVSGYFSGNVHRYDACTGAFEGVIDGQGRLAGAQASRVGPDGRLYVVAELLGRIQRFDAQTLAFIDTAVQLPANFGATGIVFRENEIWVSSYNQSLVRRFALANGQPAGDAVTSGAGGLRGADNGMVFGPDGKLYVPGYDSHSVVRHDPASNTTSAFIAARAGGLLNARGILFEPGGQHVLVSSEGNGKVLRYAVADGRFMAEFASGLQRPTGMAFHPDGSVLVATATGVVRLNASTGANLGLLASATAGLVGGPTFVTVLPRAASMPIDTAQVGSQYWIAGAGTMTGTTIVVDDMASSVGAAFGADFDPDEVVRKRWGSARIRFTSCTTGEFSWDSTGADSAGFGEGSYPLQRLLPSDATRRCETEGFGTVDDRDWVIGSWFGGPARDGEGLMIDVNTDAIAFLTWFTYRPR